MTYSEEFIRDFISIAMEGDSSNAIDWGDLNITKEQAYQLVALNVLELFPNRDIDILATMTHLIVENMILNIRLASYNE